ncbi:energy-coupling factor ABC transporter ATP-binding protein [Aerococcaceae bacterium DSM 111176]|nr:energy-coupling factor ABC transporter ATP-binding protein [Aerococcaceae bacterium DSM 111176]
MDNIIEIKNLTFSYEEDANNVLKDVSFEVKRGEWLAIIGPNGSGKSTLAKMINGLLVPQQGTIKVNDAVLSEESVWYVRSIVGMVFQNPDNQFVGATVEDDVAFGLENKGVPREEMIPRVQEALEMVNMSQFVDREPAKLSGGQKQRVAVASVYALRPDVIILDEATAMLDPKGRREVIKVIDALREAHDLTVISITHDIEEAARADRIMVLKDGEIQDIAVPEAVFSIGEGLIQMGLDLPFAEKLQANLKGLGVEVPDKYLTEEELVQWISQSYLKV